MVHKSNTTGRRLARWLPIPVAIALLVACSVARAVDPPPAARYAIEQPAQDLGNALQNIGQLTGTSVLFERRVVSGRMSRPVSGRLSGVEAIAAALEGSGLEAHVTQDGAVVVRQPVAPGDVPAAPASSAPAVVRTSAALNVDQVKALEAQGSGHSGTPEKAKDDPHALTRVEVTGSRLKRVSAEGPAPANVYTKQDIEKSGQPNLERFLAGLSEVSASTGEGGFGTTLGQGTVQLRGLPLGSTLVLINGRKVQGVGSSSGNVFNLNLIPMAAIERVEVVPMGSSAVYGGDALAGVVNVILKKSLDGQALTARLGSGRGLSDGSISLATGGQGERGSYLLMGSYSRSSPLTMRERPFFQDIDFRRLGGTDERLPYCTPGSVSSTNGGALPGLGASVAGIPTLPSGQPLKVSDFQATAGTQNLCNYWTTGGGVALVHGYETMAVHSLAEHRLFGGWTAFGEATVVKDRMHAEDSGLIVSTTVPGSNLFNPFGVDVDVTSVLGPENGVQGISRQSNFTRVLVGLRGDVAKDWDAELTVSTSRDHGASQTWNDQVNDVALSSALASTTQATALNPFTAGLAANESVLRGIWSDTVRRNRGRKDQISGQVRGSLGPFWAGPVDVIVGTEAARDRYEVTITGQPDIRGTRSSAATYGELRAPLLSATEEGRSGWDLVALTLAGRRDHYSDFGSASTFQGGLEVRPTRNLLIRGSASSSFKPPTILQTHIDDIVYQAGIFGLTDPARGGERITSGTVVRTTNKELAPEHGQARGVGAVWESEGQLGARLSATYWKLRIRGMIAVLRPQAALDYESVFPGFVTRGPSVNGQPGVVTSIKTAEANFGRVDTAGTDVDAAYSWKTTLGRVAASIGGTRTSEYRVVLAPGAAEVERLGRRFSDFWAPRWKGRVSIGLDERAWNVGLTSRYVGSYLDAGTSSRRLGDYWAHDVTGALDLKKLWPDLLPVFKAASFGLSVTNVGDRQPQYVVAAPYYDVTQADWRGRYVSARLSLDW